MNEIATQQERQLKQVQRSDAGWRVLVLVLVLVLVPVLGPGRSGFFGM